MAHDTTPARPHAAPLPHPPRDPHDPVYQAWIVMRTVFTVAPIVFGLDKFVGLLVDWDRYLAPAIAGLSPMSVHTTMYVVGVIEIVAGLIVALHPRLGACIVAAWLAGIVLNLLLVPGYYDIALRDVGLLLGAIALQRLSTRFDAHPLAWPMSRVTTH